MRDRARNIFEASKIAIHEGNTMQYNETLQILNCISDEQYKQLIEMVREIRQY